MTDDSVIVSYLEKQLDARDAWLAVSEETSGNSHKRFVLMTGSHRALRMEVDSTIATVSRCIHAIRYLANRVCKRSSSLARMQSTSYDDFLNAVCADVQIKEPVSWQVSCKGLRKRTFDPYL